MSKWDDRRLARNHAVLLESEIQQTVFETLRERASSGTLAFRSNGKNRHHLVGLGVGLGVAGPPDLVCIRRGRTFGLVLKSEGGRLTPSESSVLAAIRQAGGEAAVAYGVSGALRWLEVNGLLEGADTGRPA